MVWCLIRHSRFSCIIYNASAYSGIRYRSAIAWYDAPSLREWLQILTFFYGRNEIYRFEIGPYFLNITSVCEDISALPSIGTSSFLFAGLHRRVLKLTWQKSKVIVYGSANNHSTGKCYNNFLLIGFEVLTAVIIKSINFWDITPCSPLSVNRRFGGTYRQLSRWFLVQLIFYPEDGGDMFIRNVGWHSTDYTASYSRRWYSSVFFLCTY
jgi:hypothetical protein